MNITLGTEFQKELESEVRATRRCLEAVPEQLYSWKPHEKSMDMGYLCLLVADIPQWITWAIEEYTIDLAHYKQFQLTTTAALVKHFDSNIDNAKRALANVKNEALDKKFELKNSGRVLYTQTIKECVMSSLNHWVHHRGQLTVYMRLNDIRVPSIYGPSADERTF
ncbi:MAG TPA: DinB family protein [Chryseosolibacter sp.]